MKKLGFSKSIRLKTSLEFKEVFDKPFRSRSDYFTVLARPNGYQRPRLGIIVARKYVRRAVDRNRIKRKIRESFRLHQEKLSGLDFVVLVRCNVLKKAYKESPDMRLLKQWQELMTIWGRD